MSGCRCIALDIGEVRIGIATSDLTGAIASPRVVLPADEVRNLGKRFRKILMDHEPEILVVGLPLTLAGEEGPQAQRVRADAERIARRTGLELVFVDERLSSSEAKRILRAQGRGEKEMRGMVDMVAASLLLQTYLDERHRENDTGGHRG